MLRSRENSREHFIEMRKHVMIKIEILNEKHVRELGLHLRSMLEALHENHNACTKILDEFASNNFGEIEESNSMRRKNDSFDDNDIEHGEQAEPLLISTED